MSGWEFADVGSQQDVRVMLCPGGSIQACVLRPRPCAKASCRHIATVYPYTDSHSHVPPRVAPAPAPPRAPVYRVRMRVSWAAWCGGPGMRRQNSAGRRLLWHDG